MIISAKDGGDGTYVITWNNGPVRFGVGPASRFWQELQTWFAAGNEPLPVDPKPTPEPPPLTVEEVWAVLEAKNLVTPGDRPRPKPE